MIRHGRYLEATFNIDIKVKCDMHDHFLNLTHDLGPPLRAPRRLAWGESKVTWERVGG